MRINERIASVLASVLAVGALALPSAAQARPNTNPVNASGVIAVEAQPSTSEGSGFQWGDAGIGAGAAALLLGAGAAATEASRRRRGRSAATS
jgi:hypothetical protein